MATPATLRRDIAEINRRMARDISGIWRPFEVSTDSVEALRDLLGDIIAAYGSAAATVSVDWYDELREEVEAPRRFASVPAQIAEVGAQSLIGWALAEATTDQAFETLLLGGAQRRMANFSRLTLTQSAVADPSAVGWRRVGLGRCDFCRMLIGRGAVYREATADFEAHDSCACSAEPDFGT